jgi:glucose/arabinose dehydrogenase
MKNLRVVFGLLLVSIFLFSFIKKNKEQQDSKEYELVVSNLTIPWGFTFLPDSSMLITEKEGKLTHFKNGKKQNITGLPKIKEQGQGGLMDIELHPNYRKTGWIYFTYASGTGVGNGANTTLMRARLNNNRLINQEVLYKASPNTRRGQHFGSRIAFDTKGYVYFSVGDRGNRDVNPQDITKDGGKIYRLHDDGRIPVDNPFVKEKNAKTAIYSFGHRNPQGMEINPFTREIWSHEHGPQGGDEINIIKKGKNYGWPKASYGINYSGTKFTDKTTIAGMKSPLHHWTPSIAPSGMAFVNSKKYPKMNGNLLVGSLKFRYISYCTLKNGKVIKEEKILEGLGRVRSIEQGNDGYLYAGIEQLGIVRILPRK